MIAAQQSILKDNPPLTRHLFFSMIPGADYLAALKALIADLDTSENIMGLGECLCLSLNAEVPGLRTMPAISQPGVSIPSTPFALWLCLRGDDHGDLYYRSEQIESVLSAAFTLEDIVDCFMYKDSRDLSGYVDGTENPTGEEAIAAAIVTDCAKHNGSSFVAIQTWLHDIDHLKTMSTEEKDNMIGRHIADNEEFDAPITAHVKRAAQEDFEPEAFILRRSMPWTDGMNAGLLFIAFGKSLDAYEAILHRMTGAEDGHTDALFQFTQPQTGAYFWCPPATNNRIDLSALF